VPEGSEVARLALQTSNPLRVLRESIRECLEGNLSAQLGVTGMIDFARTAFTEFLDDLVVRNGPADQGILSVVSRRIP
jgi:hypothetical protein